MLHNHSKDDTRKCLFTDEKYFYLNGIYNSQNDLVWVASRKGAFRQRTKHPRKVTVWLGACAKGLTTPVIFWTRNDECKCLHQ